MTKKVAVKARDSWGFGIEIWRGSLGIWLKMQYMSLLKLFRWILQCNLGTVLSNYSITVPCLLKLIR